MSKYEPYYDDIQELWTVKETSSQIGLPMISENMANEVCKLLNNYDERLHEALDELIKKDNEIDKLLIYEIWLSGYSGSMTMYDDQDTIVARFMDKKKAYAKMNELNNECNYGKPYYMNIVELEG